MSLINQMLSDLEARRGAYAANDEHALDGLQPVPAAHAAGTRRRTARRLLGAALSGGLAAGVVWYGLDALEAKALGTNGHSTVAHDAASALSHGVAATAPPSQAALRPPVPAARPGGAQSPAPGPAVSLALLDLPYPQQPLAEAAPALARSQPTMPAAAMPSTPVDAEAGPALDVAAALAPVVIADIAVSAAPTIAAPTPEAPDGATRVTVHAGSIQRAVARAPVVDTRVAQLEAAHALFAEKRDSAGFAALQALVEAEPHFIAARTAYAGELFKRGQAADAAALLRVGLAGDRNAYAYAMMLGHIMLQRNDAPGALEILAAAVPRVSVDTEYHAFMAALQQRLGRHRDAIATYRRVLAARPEHGVWWLGLGISLAHENQGVDASRAFRRALVDRGLSDNLRQYANREIGRLVGTRS